MGLDIGDRTLGVAIGDSTWTIASPETTVRRTRFDDDVKALKVLIVEHEVSLLVTGLPLRLDGHHSEQTRKTQVTARRLAVALALPHSEQDERFTTVAAHRTLRAAGLRMKAQREVVDAVAAALILQTFLDTRRAVPPARSV